MRQTGFIYGVLLLSGLSVAGCDDAAENGNGQENTESLCADGEDNDGDGASDCDDGECAGFDHCNPPAIVPDVSGMPIPPADAVPQPTGSPSNLVILDWAGFKAALTYTFDDTHPSHIEHYDTLQATGAHMTFFAVNATATDTEAWSRAVDDGHEIGNHTAHHCHAGLSGECAWGTALETPEAEIETCSELITGSFGQEGVWSMASPYGESWWSFYAKKVVLLNRSVNRGTIAPNGGINPFNLPSVMLAGNAKAETMNEDIDAVYADGEWLIFCFHAILPTTQDGSGGVHIDEITGTIEHGQALGDLWIDSMVNIGAYWMGQKTIEAITPQTASSETVWTWALPNHFPRGKYLRVVVDGGTLTQHGNVLPWSPHGYYEVALDAGVLTLSP